MSIVSKARRLLRSLTSLKARAFVGKVFRALRKNRNRRLIEISVIVSKIVDTTDITLHAPALQAEPQFTVLIMCSSRDLEKLLINLKQLRILYGETLKIAVLHQDSDVFEEIDVKENLSNIYFINENTYHEELSQIGQIVRRFNPDRHSWILQQCLKTIYVAGQKSPVLILDCDTLITKKIDFLPDGKNLLLVGSKEHSHYHFPYSAQFSKYMGVEATPINFVHHCQIQFPEIVKEIYSKDTIRGINRWLLAGLKPFEFSAVSEFQTYGEFMFSYYPERIRLFSHRHHLEHLDGLKIRQHLDMSTDLTRHLMQKCNPSCDLVTWGLR